MATGTDGCDGGSHDDLPLRVALARVQQQVRNILTFILGDWCQKAVLCGQCRRHAQSDRDSQEMRSHGTHQPSLPLISLLQRLILTSSASVVYERKDIENGDEVGIA